MKPKHELIVVTAANDVCEGFCTCGEWSIKGRGNAGKNSHSSVIEMKYKEHVNGN